jgi:hypothetical protein
MNTIVISPSNVVTFPEGGGHFWVYMQYVQGFLAHDCDVYWLERFVSSGDTQRDSLMLKIFKERMDKYGLKERTVLYELDDSKSSSSPAIKFINVSQTFAESLFKKADLLLNFYYSMPPLLLNQFKRTALVDIDPGLLQFWISTGQLKVSGHDYYFTTGETVGTKNALFSDCGLSWIKIRPPVSLEYWPYRYNLQSEVFTTVSGWWGGDGKGEFITDGQGTLYENNKRVTFLQYVRLPQLISQKIELALNLGDGDKDDGDEQKEKSKSRVDGVTDYISDAIDVENLRDHQWLVRNAYEVANSPEAYQSYIQNSRGEFSCVKPSCLKFQNAWISDRTICYLASGKPVVIQDTGPSEFLPDGEGMFRFSTIEEAVNAFNEINSNYEKHCQAARDIAESYFDAKIIVNMIRDCC